MRFFSSGKLKKNFINILKLFLPEPYGPTPNIWLLWQNLHTVFTFIATPLRGYSKPPTPQPYGTFLYSFVWFAPYQFTKYFSKLKIRIVSGVKYLYLSMDWFFKNCQFSENFLAVRSAVQNIFEDVKCLKYSIHFQRCQRFRIFNLFPKM